MGTIKTTNIEPIADNGTVTLGSSGDTITIPSGVTQSGVGGTNTPAFLANLSSTQSLSNNTNTTVVFDNEVFDTDSGYDTSTGIFTVPSGKGGKYLIGAYPTITATSGATIFRCLITKNGTSTSVARADIRIGDNGVGGFAENTPPCSAIVDLSASDTLRVIARIEGGSGTLRISDSSSNTASQFFVTKLIE